MAEYPGYKHGTRAEINANGISVTDKGKTKQAIVYIGTAPVQQVEGGASNVNVPILCNDMSDARKYLGYSDNWAAYTLCEAMHAHFELNGVGPVVFINVLSPVTHKASTAGTATLTPENGRVKIASAENIILDSVVVKSGETTKVKDTDYTIAYDFEKQVINIVEKASGALGTTALTITYNSVDPSLVTEANVIGSTDNYGLNTGVYAVKNVYNVTGYIPAFILAPGFSSSPAVHNAMCDNSQQIAGHWNAWLFVDMPIVDAQSTAITMATAPTWKENNGYNHDNESVFFPMAKGVDGKKYHLSVLNAANFQQLLNQNNGIPYMTASNTAAEVIEDLYMGENVTGRVYSDDIINRCLNANGISSAAYVGGRWAIWGMHAASYNQDNASDVNVFDTCLMMLYFVTNDFQHRRNPIVDKPMQINDLKTMVAEEQTRLDALVGTGALTYGKVNLIVTKDAISDMQKGDYRIEFKVTNTPLMKSLTGIATRVPDGFAVYFQSLEASA